MQNDSVSKMSSVQNTKQWTKYRNQVILRPLRKKTALTDLTNLSLMNWKLEVA
jgi:hypothetical protein